MQKHDSHRRDVLDRLRRTSTAAGPLEEGLRDFDKIVVASFFSPYVCRRFRRALTTAGVRSVVRKEDGKWFVEVGYAQRDAAHELALRQKSEYPDRRPSGTRGAYDFTLLGGVAGALMGIVSLRLSNVPSIQGTVWLGLTGMGIAFGYLADRFQRSYRYLGRLQFNTVDCLLLTTVTALALSFWILVSCNRNRLPSETRSRHSSGAR